MADSAQRALGITGGGQKRKRAAAKRAREAREKKEREKQAAPVASPIEVIDVQSSDDEDTADDSQEEQQPAALPEQQRESDRRPRAASFVARRRIAKQTADMERKYPIKPTEKTRATSSGSDMEEDDGPQLNLKPRAATVATQADEITEADESARKRQKVSEDSHVNVLETVYQDYDTALNKVVDGFNGLVVIKNALHDALPAIQQKADDLKKALADNIQLRLIIDGRVEEAKTVWHSTQQLQLTVAEYKKTNELQSAAIDRFEAMTANAATAAAAAASSFSSASDKKSREPFRYEWCVECAPDGTAARYQVYTPIDPQPTNPAIRQASFDDTRLIEYLEDCDRFAPCMANQSVRIHKYGDALARLVLFQWPRHQKTVADVVVRYMHSLPDQPFLVAPVLCDAPLKGFHDKAGCDRMIGFSFVRKTDAGPKGVNPFLFCVDCVLHPDVLLLVKSALDKLEVGTYPDASFRVAVDEDTYVIGCGNPKCQQQALANVVTFENSDVVTRICGCDATHESELPESVPAHRRINTRVVVHAPCLSGAAASQDVVMHAAAASAPMEVSVVQSAPASPVVDADELRNAEADMGALDLVDMSSGLSAPASAPAAAPGPILSKLTEQNREEVRAAAPAHRAAEQQEDADGPTTTSEPLPAAVSAPVAVLAAAANLVEASTAVETTSLQVRLEHAIVVEAAAQQKLDATRKMIAEEKASAENAAAEELEAARKQQREEDLAEIAKEQRFDAAATAAHKAAEKAAKKSAKKSPRPVRPRAGQNRHISPSAETHPTKGTKAPRKQQ